MGIFPQAPQPRTSLRTRTPTPYDTGIASTGTAHSWWGPTKQMGLGSAGGNAHSRTGFAPHSLVAGPERPLLARVAAMSARPCLFLIPLRFEGHNCSTHGNARLNFTGVFNFHRQRRAGVGVTRLSRRAVIVGRLPGHTSRGGTGHSTAAARASRCCPAYPAAAELG